MVHNNLKRGRLGGAYTITQEQYRACCTSRQDVTTADTSIGVKYCARVQR